MTSSSASVGTLFGNTGLAVLTPSGLALVAVLSAGLVCAVGMTITALERHYGLIARVRKNQEVANDLEYRQMVRKMSKAGRILRRKSMQRELTLTPLDSENRREICAVCNRCVADANLGSATSALLGAISKDASLNSYLCVDCFANLDPNEFQAAHKIKDGWAEQLASPTSGRKSSVAKSEVAVGVEHADGTKTKTEILQNVTDDVKKKPKRSKTKKGLRKSKTKKKLKKRSGTASSIAS